MRAVEKVQRPILCAKEKERLVEYDSFVMILKSERPGRVEVDVAVEEAGAAEPAHP